jgi:hypothetical protein
MRRALEESVTWIASELVAAGYRADVSLGSLEELDRYIDDNTDNGEPKSGVLLRQKGRCVLALGAYVGEAIRRAQGGQWFLDPDRPNDIFHIQLRLDDGLCMWPCPWRHRKRHRKLCGSTSIETLTLPRILGERASQARR